MTGNDKIIASIKMVMTGDELISHIIPHHPTSPISHVSQKSPFFPGLFEFPPLDLRFFQWPISSHHPTSFHIIPRIHGRRFLLVPLHLAEQRLVPGHGAARPGWCLATAVGRLRSRVSTLPDGALEIFGNPWNLGDFVTSECAFRNCVGSRVGYLPHSVIPRTHRVGSPS